VPAYDVVVAGGGTAGCVLAARLSEEPSRTVCLVEAGHDYGRYADGRWPADILDGSWLALESHCWPTEREDRSQLRARILGGCSAHNACIVLPGAPSDYEWGDGWGYAELEPYLRRVEAELEPVVRGRDDLSPWHGAWADAAGDDTLLHPCNVRGTTRWNLAFAYVDPARNRPNLEIRADTLVDRVLLEGDRAVGVATDHGPIAARTVVLAAGAYGTPGVLLRSGIGPGLPHDLPVGEHLNDHVGVGVAWAPTARTRRELAAHTGWTSMAQLTVRARSASCPPGVSDLFLFPALGLLPESGEYELSAAVFAMKPLSRGSVTLVNGDPRSPLRIDHGFLSDERDVPVLVEGLELLRSYAASPEIAAYAGEELRPGSSVPADEHARTAPRGFFHPTSTCSVGLVVDARARVLGLDGLVVADASIVPSVPSANTNLTVAAVAERIADLF
jgi:choline dehydrogenase